jgi:hypothetical protein
MARLSRSASVSRGLEFEEPELCVFVSVTRRTELPDLYIKYLLYEMADAGGGAVGKHQIPRLCTWVTTP